MPDLLVADVCEALRAYARPRRVRLQRHDASRARPTAIRPPITSRRSVATARRASIDDVLVNDTPVSDERAAAYAHAGRAPSRSTTIGWSELGVHVVHAPSPRAATSSATTRRAWPRRLCAWRADGRVVRSRKTSSASSTPSCRRLTIAAARSSRASVRRRHVRDRRPVAGTRCARRSALPATARRALGLLQAASPPTPSCARSDSPSRPALRSRAGRRRPASATADRGRRADESLQVQWRVPRRIVDQAAAAWSRSCAACSSAAGRSRRPARRCTPSSRSKTRILPRTWSACWGARASPSGPRCASATSPATPSAANPPPICWPGWARTTPVCAGKNRRCSGRVRERANRLANCDEANARRAAEAGRRQVDDARLLQSSRAWPALAPGLRSAAELRLRHPYLSLQELAVLARPPVSKSWLNHRFRRLHELADEARALGR